MQPLPLPKQLASLENDGSHAVFALEPLYPGYGITVGNALRRVLLSSLPGAAITSVKIEGGTHEFTTLPYVKEDAVDIILNLKQVRLKLHGDGPVTLTLEASGAKTVTAGDIQATADVEIINVDQPIATLTDKAGKLTMELTVEKGRGYVPVEQREKEKPEIGTIAIDAIFTPIKNVNFTTEHVRVEQMTNYDKLVMDITTDGTISPNDALTQAAQIMVEHFQFILGGVGDLAPAELEAEPKKKSKKKAEADEAPAEETEA